MSARSHNKPTSAPRNIHTSGDAAPANAVMFGTDQDPWAARGRAAPPRNTFKEKIGDLLEIPDSSMAAQVVHYFLIATIITSTLAVIIETLPECSRNPIFFPLEACINALFTIEFALRLYACESLAKFAMNRFNLIDFLAVFPGYVDMVIVLTQEDEVDTSQVNGLHQAAGSMRALRMIRIVRLVRVFRVLRVAKVARHSKLVSILFAVFRKVSQSGLVVVLMLMAFVTVLSASFIYLFESELCEDTGAHCVGPSAFVSIPAATWWSIATLTTVGYGDMVPHTVAGRIVGALTAIAGVIIIAIGIALVSINFREVFIEEKARADLRSRRGRMDSLDYQQEETEMVNLLRNFDQKSEALFSKLRAVSMRQDVGRDLLPMLDVLTSHSKTLSSDAKVFVSRFLHGEAAGSGSRLNGLLQNEALASRTSTLSTLRDPCDLRQACERVDVT